MLNVVVIYKHQAKIEFYYKAIMNKFIIVGLLLLTGCFPQGQESKNPSSEAVAKHEASISLLHQEYGMQQEQIAHIERETQQLAHRLSLDIERIRVAEGEGAKRVGVLESKLASLEQEIERLHFRLAESLKQETPKIEVEGFEKELRKLESDLKKGLSLSQEKIVHQEEIQKKLLGKLDAILSALDASPSPSLIASKLKSAGPNAEQSTAHIYKVKLGDTLEKIARANHTSVQAIREKNSLKSDMIRVGQELVIVAP
jgi:LysM repeat protein